jgi:hypothetical protein
MIDYPFHIFAVMLSLTQANRGKRDLHLLGDGAVTAFHRAFHHLLDLSAWVTATRCSLSRRRNLVQQNVNSINGITGHLAIGGAHG